jgi:signal transduction histidine kinase
LGILLIFNEERKMKLLYKINRNYLILLIGILLISAIAGFFTLQGIILNEAKESLINKETLLVKQIEESGEIPNLYPLIEVKKIQSLTTKFPEFNEVFIQNSNDDELEPYLEYSNQIRINGACYSIKLRQSFFENEDLVSLLTISLFTIISIALAVSFFVGKKINKNVWTDFEHNLKLIENFSFSSREQMTLLESDIQEFDRLNRVVKKLTEKLQIDYFLLKEFTENASHEIQTPLSIALLNLDEILQKDLSEEVFKKVLATINSLKRLSSLNQGLILLTKIENKQFEANKYLIINKIIYNCLDEFIDLFESKKLKVEFFQKGDFRIKMNEQLAILLINNLLSNTFKHNCMNGSVTIKVDENSIKICNTGEPNTLDSNTVFERFSKGNSSSFGLGLAIVKKIADTHDLEITYSQAKQHCFIICKKL